MDDRQRVDREIACLFRRRWTPYGWDQLRSPTRLDWTERSRVRTPLERSSHCAGRSGIAWGRRGVRRFLRDADYPASDCRCAEGERPSSLLERPGDDRAMDGA